MLYKLFSSKSLPLPNLLSQTSHLLNKLTSPQGWIHHFLNPISFSFLVGFSGGAGSKECLQCRRCKRCGFDPWIGKISWRKAWQPSPVFLPTEIPWTEEPGWLQPITLFFLSLRLYLDGSAFSNNFLRKHDGRQYSPVLISIKIILPSYLTCPGMGLQVKILFLWEHFLKTFLDELPTYNITDEKVDTSFFKYLFFFLSFFCRIMQHMES